MDSYTCTYINTFTNVIALVPLWKYITKKDYIGSLICCSSFVASCLMHMSETKHNLPGIHFKEYSNILLNIDRFFAFFLSGYAGSNFLKNPTLFPVITFGIGIIASIIGETTNNLTKYTIFHTIWHLFSYGTLAYTI
jgi:hypothetical protein